MLNEALEILEKILSEEIRPVDYAVDWLEFSTDSGRKLSLPVFEASDIFLKEPTNCQKTDFQKEALRIWNNTGMILIKNFLDSKCTDMLHSHAESKIGRF